MCSSDLVGIPSSVDFTFIQPALMAVNTPGLVHVVITLIVPLLGLIFGPLFFYLRATGWWGIIILSSYNVFLYSTAFIKSYIFDTVIRFENLLMLHWTDVNLLLRAILYTSILLFTFRMPVMELYGVAKINKLKVGSFLALANILLAISVYQWK